MKSRLPFGALLVVSACLTWRPAATAQTAAAPFAGAASSSVPNLITYTGILKDSSGRPLTSLTGVTFLLYNVEQGGAPLWLETQNVTPDEMGHYTVQLGATSSKGLPSDLFVSGQARWLALQIVSETEQARVLLVAVPYAMKAVDAETVGGLPPSAFVLAPTGVATKVPGLISSTSSSSAPPTAKSNVTTTGGAPQRLPLFTTATNIQNSIVTQTGTTVIDVAGKLGINTTAPSQSLDVTSGNAIIRGVGNFRKPGDTATFYVGDTSHPIEAIWNSGLAIGAFKAPEAILISDFTGNVGIGTTTTTNGILNTVANSQSVVGLSTAGWSAPVGSGANGTDAIHATGGDGDPGSSYCCGGAGIVATGGREGGVGVIATGSTGSDQSAPGVIGTGGCNEGIFACDPGVVANGGPLGLGGFGGDGIDAIGTGLGFSGSFTGDVNIAGSLNVSGTKFFRIDHPLNPANKYLYHAALESSEVLNLYTGNATLDLNGEATVQLPDWFEALNRDFRYQLTAIGAPAPNLHVAQKVQNNRFKIAGGSAGLEVSWQVTCVRQDAWEKAHPMAVEVEKPPREQGYYINPELFGAPPEKSLDWARHPQLMRRMRDIQEKQAKDARATLASPVKSAKPKIRN